MERSPREIGVRGSPNPSIRARPKEDTMQDFKNYQLTEAPDFAALLIALGERTNNPRQRLVRWFTIQVGENPRQTIDLAVNVNGIQWEDGSGKNFNINAFCVEAHGATNHLPPHGNPVRKTLQITVRYGQGRTGAVEIPNDR